MHLYACVCVFVRLCVRACIHVLPFVCKCVLVCLCVVV